MILGYPAVKLYEKGAKKDQPHTRLVAALLGKKWTAKQAESLNLVNHVNSDSIPMFCWSTASDALTKAAPILEFAGAYANADRPFELHMFQFGEHGLSLANHITANGRQAMADATAAKWVDLSVDWIHRNFGVPELNDGPYQMPDKLKSLLAYLA